MWCVVCGVWCVVCGVKLSVCFLLVCGVYVWCVCVCGVSTPLLWSDACCIPCAANHQQLLQCTLDLNPRAVSSPQRMHKRKQETATRITSIAVDEDACVWWCCLCCRCAPCLLWSAVHCTCWECVCFLRHLLTDPSSPPPPPLWFLQSLCVCGHTCGASVQSRHINGSRHCAGSARCLLWACAHVRMRARVCVRVRVCFCVWFASCLWRFGCLLCHVRSSTPPLNDAENVGQGAQHYDAATRDCRSNAHCCLTHCLLGACLPSNELGYLKLFTVLCLQAVLYAALCIVLRA